MGDASMVERLVNGLIRVEVLSILTVNCDADLVLRISQPMHQVAPVVEFKLARETGPAELRASLWLGLTLADRGNRDETMR